jgi:hypothetical protein
MRRFSQRAVSSLALLGLLASAIGCGQSSKSNGEPIAGSSGKGGGGGSSGSEANGGASGETPSGGRGSQGGTAGSTAGGSGGSSGMSGHSTGTGGIAAGAGGGSGSSATNGGVDSSAGGAAGDGTAGEPSAGAGSGGANCRDLCTDDAPACCGDELRCVTGPTSCRIDVLEGIVGITYEYAELERKIAELTGNVLVSVTDAEVEFAAADPPSAARFELRLSRQLSRAQVEALAGALDHPFRVSCNEQELFVGVVYIFYGAAALMTPVMHVDDSDPDAMVLRLGAWQSAWMISSPSSNEALRERLDRPELRAAFCARGILGVLDEQ